MKPGSALRAFGYPREARSSPPQGGGNVWWPSDATGEREMCLAIPGQVLEVVDEPNRLATVDVAGVVRTVNIGLLDGDDAGSPGDWVLIHVGFAISKVDEDEARTTLDLLERMGAAYEQELAELRGSAIE
jgi:hydrogenase expression/formation protein HypC